MEEIDSVENIQNEISRFYKDPITKKLQDRYSKKSYLEILGISRWESSHSHFLSWLLNPEGEHGLSYFALKRLLMLAEMKNDNIIKGMSNELVDIINTDAYTIRDQKTILENPIPGGRTDIFLDFSIITQAEYKIRIIIENKVKSKEHRDQTVTYYNHFASEGKYINIFLFLSPENDKPKSNNFIKIDYQDVLENILEPALHQNINKDYKLLISDYIKALGQPSIGENDEEKRGALIMATGQEEKKLLNKFWENNKKLIMMVVDAKYKDDPDDEDIQRMAKKIYSKRPQMNFLKLGMKPGDTIQFKDNSKYVAKIISGTKVEYKKKQYLLKELTDELLVLIGEQRPSGRSAGRYWLYNGELLRDIYYRKYS